MRLSLRFILPLLVVLTLIAYAVIPLVDQLALSWFVRDLDLRSSLIANTIQEPLQERLASERESRAPPTLKYFEKIIEDERLFAIAFCESATGTPIATKTFPKDLGCDETKRLATLSNHLIPRTEGLLHISVKPLPEVDGKSAGDLVLVHDMSFVQRRSEQTKRYVFYFFAAMAFVVSLLTVLIAQLSWRGWVQGIQGMLRGEGLLRPVGTAEKTPIPELQPIARDIRSLIRDLQAECRTRDESQISWTPESLRAILRQDLQGEAVLVVSNREPYIHVRQDGRIEVQRPASGLVTAMEPIMRACSGTWIAHGSGSADRDTVDDRNRVDVPPGNPSYRIRRVWLTKEEEAGYYYGLANEGLWPLCHIAHLRPIFRPGDWEQYVAVNRKFAQAVVEEAKSDAPIVLVQDYHFALLPRMIRERLPNAIVIAFWHIPWPNPESFAICPWRLEILHGMLGSSILGFHTQFHVNNFVDTVDRLLESRVDRETLTISYGKQLTAVKRYPISIDWPPAPELLEKPVETCRAEIGTLHHFPAEHLVGVGVDRLDYTKGILERFLAVERLLELEPQWVGRFTFIQIAAPTRSSIESYHSFDAQVRALAIRINKRFGREGYEPIRLLVAHHDSKQVYEYYRAADFCFVSSLHDGMNLVAKEFIAARDDETGVLILSQFTGAARELPESLVVNPYDVDQCAMALHVALTMPKMEQRNRMRIMRSLVAEFNVYRWAGRMLLDAAAMKQRGRISDLTISPTKA
jgi:trehalose 6-phosphate synthase